MAIEKTNTERHKRFTRRAVLLAGGQAALFGALAGRLYYLQIIEGDRYQLLAEENRINVQLIQPHRGRIVDRYGIALADNEQNYRVLLTAERSSDVRQTVQALAGIIDLDEPAVVRILEDVARQKNFVPVTVAEFLDWQDVAEIEVNTPDLPGVSIDVGERRFYPQSALAAHVLGYVARVSEDDLNGDPLLETPGFRIGRTGIERRYDELLRGRAGSRQLEVNASGRVVRELQRTDAHKGGDVVLAMDMALQRFATERLGEESGAIVVMDVHSGDVLTLASTPSFDPSLFTEGLSTEDWRALADDERAPLRNKAIAGEFSPGSTFKPVVALAGLEAGVIGPGTRVTCHGHMQLGNRRFHCWRRGGHGSVDLNDAIAQSCDVYFYEVAQRLGIDRIAEMARTLGLGDDFDLDIPGERSGLVPTKAWKQAVIGDPWVAGETLISGIGQGFLLTTPMQLAVMTARLVNGGRAVRPNLVRAAGLELPERLPLSGGGLSGVGLSGAGLSGGGLDGGGRAGGEDLPPTLATGLPDPASSTVSAAAPLAVQQQHLDFVRRAMVAVTTSPRGTAYRSRIGEGELEMGGKTGTVQVRRITRAERAAGIRSNDQLPWKFRDHALFIGFGPVDNPKYAIAVVIEHGGGGSSAAAPVARDVMELTLRRDRALGFASGASTPASPPSQNEREG